LLILVKRFLVFKKMQLFKHDLITKNFNHSLRLKNKCSKIEDQKLEEYQNKLQELLDDFKLRYLKIV